MILRSMDMHTSSGRNDPTSPNRDLGPLLTAVIALCILLFGLPAWLLGFFAQRHVSRWLSWRWSLLLWFTLACLSAYALSFLYQHGLQGRLARELTGYVLAAKYDQIDFTRWPWSTLWADTWPVWLHT